MSDFGPVLTAGGWRAILAPAVGGCVAALSHDGVDILRPAADGADDATQMACFPMAPYVGRIAEGLFRFEGVRHRLPPNFPYAAPHSLHGPSWQSPWRVEAANADRATMVHDYAAGEAWPWSYQARQEIRLDAAGLKIALTLTNSDARAMPAGVGLHPYFPLTPQTRLRFAARRLWLNDDAGLPQRTVPADHFVDWSAGAAARAPEGVDNLYDGWDGRARLGNAVLTADAPLMHLFQLKDGNFLCLEPATQRPNQLNSDPAATTVLAPGASLSLTMGIGLDTEA